MRILKKRRALSPIIAVVLMFLLIMAAIGLAIGFMGPNLIRFKDKNYNNNNHLYFTGMDSMIRSIIRDIGPVTTEYLFVQQEGDLSVTSDWIVMFLLHEGSQTSLIFQENLTRIIHRSNYVTDYDVGEHRYLVGPQDQDYLGINGSVKLYNDITVLNESRTRFEPAYLNLALYYRYVFSSDYEIRGNTEIYNLDIVHVNLISNNTQSLFTGKYLNMNFTYNGTTIVIDKEIYFSEDTQGELRIVDNYGKFLYEYPIFYPINVNYNTHIINLRMINIGVIVPII